MVRMLKVPSKAVWFGGAILCTGAAVTGMFAGGPVACQDEHYVAENSTLAPFARRVMDQTASGKARMEALNQLRPKISAHLAQVEPVYSSLLDSLKAEKMQQWLIYAAWMSLAEIPSPSVADLLLREYRSADDKRGQWVLLDAMGKCRIQPRQLKDFLSQISKTDPDILTREAAGRALAKIQSNLASFRR